MGEVIENAEIKSTMLGVEDHGIMSSYIFVEFGEHYSCGFGGYALDGYDAQKKDRVPTVAMGVFVAGVLAALEVEKWERLPGTLCRIKIDPTISGTISAIGHFRKNKWFCPKDAFEAMKNGE